MGLALSGESEMNVIPTIADELFAAHRIGARLSFAPEPGIFILPSMGFCASVLIVEGNGNGAEQPSALLSDIPREKEGTNVLADPIVDVRVPGLSLLFEQLPPYKNVERCLAFEDGGEFGLEGTGSPEARGGSGFVGFGVFVLLLDPVAEVAIGELLQHCVVEAMIVDEGVKPVGATIPEMPDERAIVK